MERRVVRVSLHIVEALVIENLPLRQELGEKTAHWKLKFEELHADGKKAKARIDYLYKIVTERREE